MDVRQKNWKEFYAADILVIEDKEKHKREAAQRRLADAEKQRRTEERRRAEAEKVLLTPTQPPTSGDAAPTAAPAGEPTKPGATQGPEPTGVTSTAATASPSNPAQEPTDRPAATLIQQSPLIEADLGSPDMFKQLALMNELQRIERDSGTDESSTSNSSLSGSNNFTETEANNFVC